MQKIKKIFIILSYTTVFFTFLFLQSAMVAYAESAARDAVPGNDPAAQKDIGSLLSGPDTGTGILGKTLFANVKGDPRELAREIIFIVFGFLGTLMVALIIYSGFLWMQSKEKGEKEKITAAKGHLNNSIIGGIIVMSAWTISYFVLEALKKTVQQ